MTAATNNPWRYTGGYYDIEGDGYTHLGARYYDNHSHFNQPDPKQGSINDPLSTLAYGYADGDPMNGSDVTGRFDLGEVLAGGIIIIGADLLTSVPLVLATLVAPELVPVEAPLLEGVGSAATLFGIGLISAGASS